jgi:hypothetical protein
MNLGFWKLEMGSLANSTSPAEVAKAKSIQQNTNLFVAAMEIHERVEDDQRGYGVVLQP